MYRRWVYAEPMVNDLLTVRQFAMREQAVPEIGPGEALVRVNLINIHAGTRHRMVVCRTKLGDTDYSNFACGEVIRSRDPVFREGDAIACQAGWQELQVVRSSDPSVGYDAASEAVQALNRTKSQWCYVFRPEIARAWSVDVRMDVFGTSGMTAWFGMRECALQGGEQVAIAAATGSVGALVAQLARVAGCRVVGFAGGPERCASAKETLGLDQCLNYRSSDFAEQLRIAFPDGIDVFSDGVGGAMTETVVPMIRRGGRLFSYGSAANYYAEGLTAALGGSESLRRSFGISQNLESVLAWRQIRCHAWIVDSFYHERLRAEDELSRLLRSGALKPINCVVDGFERLPQAIVSMYQSPPFGKLQIRLACTPLGGVAL
jgi:NADPH-dependent curcumin reductase CurA